jgi:hypothetical protein
MYWQLSNFPQNPFTLLKITEDLQGAFVCTCVCVWQGGVCVIAVDTVFKIKTENI